MATRADKIMQCIGDTPDDKFSVMRHRLRLANSGFTNVKASQDGQYVTLIFADKSSLLFEFDKMNRPIDVVTL